MSNEAGLAGLVREIKSASENIRVADEANKQVLDGVRARQDSLETSINDLYKRAGRPGAEHNPSETTERRDAIEMCKARHANTVKKAEEVEYSPPSAEVDSAIAAQRGLRQYLRHGNMDKLSGEYRKSLSAFSFGPPGNFLLPPTQASRILSCLVDPTDLSGLVDQVTISGPTLAFLIDNARMAVGAWACESGCFANNPSPDEPSNGRPSAPLIVNKSAAVLWFIRK
jgi:HK97 family phage major capsid protein